MFSAHQRVFQQLLCTWGIFAANQEEKNYVSLEQVIVDNNDYDKEIGESILEDFNGAYEGDIDVNIESPEIGDVFNVDDTGKESRSNSVTEIRIGKNN